MLDRMFLKQGSAGPLSIGDVFSTKLYTGNGGTQTITNGINLAGKGGLVWLKDRTTNYAHWLFDTARGQSLGLNTNTTSALVNTGVAFQSFNSNGFTLGSGSQFNASGDATVSWTFREAPKFFDIVTYTGDGTSNPSRSFSHNLGVKPGFIIVKATGATGNWYAVAFDGTNYKRSSAGIDFGLNLTNESAANLFGGTTYLSATNFQLGAIVPDVDATPSQRDKVNANGITYTAYLFAHDTAPTGFIQCGSYTGNGSATGPVVTLGWEPQWLLIKRATGSSSYSWVLLDNARGLGVSDPFLIANNNDKEYSAQFLDTTATGFQLKATYEDVNASGSTYIYIAIRGST